MSKEARLQAGQVAVITGGAAGIGLALGKALLQRGLKVVLADCDEDALSTAAAALSADESDVIGVPTDVSRQPDLVALRGRTLEVFGRVDLLFNNAGIYPGMQPVWSIELDAWRRLFDINYWGVVHGIQAFVPHFLSQGRGTIVNTASMSGLSTVPGSADYGSAKHAVVAVSETLRADLDMAGQSQIGVTVLCPSVVMTDMGRRALGLFETSGEHESRKQIGSGPDLSAVISADDLAQAAIAGIEAGHRYVMPTPRSRDRFLGRIDPILDAFAAYPVSHGLR
ncbi:MAG: SDR family NAD(P)-dependent oxidoreductase [Burkholderiaceae bacterium]